MSRIRVYELAKEAGMSSKALTDKLIEEGYDIKGHSSSVDDETADKIRDTILKSANTELVEKRIDEKDGPTIIRRRATVIRRRAKTPDEEQFSEPDEEFGDNGDEQDEVAEEQAQAHEVVPEIKEEEKEPQILADRSVKESPKPARAGMARVISRPTPPVVEKPKVAAPTKPAPAKPEPVVTSQDNGQAESVARTENPGPGVLTTGEVGTVVVSRKVSEESSVSDANSKGPDKAESAKEAPAPVTAEGDVTAHARSNNSTGEAVRDTKENAPKRQAGHANGDKRTGAPASQGGQKKEMRDKAEKKQPPQRKPMARVVRTIELPDMDNNNSTGGSGGGGNKPKKKGTRPAGNTARRGNEIDDMVIVSNDDNNRAKKKGKKGGQEDDGRDDVRKGGKKGQKNVKFTHFGADYNGREGGGRRGKKGRRMAKPVAAAAEMKASKKRFKVFDTISVGDLAMRMKVKASEVIAKLMGLGVMATINQPVDVETAMLIATDFGYEVEQGITEEIGIQLFNESEEGGERTPRSPVVTVMGHVDHGKTSILDAIRKTDVALGEAGGITQHIGAYHVRSSSGDVTFVDTPGHAAFTEMRSRGAQVTDIVVLVVAADDGVMDQTREAIHHAQAAEVPIIVAVNKIDKDNADIDRVKRELSELNLMPEEWGGETMYCETSAKKNIGIENLMETIQVLAEILELRADKARKARGRVIEAQLHKGRGAVATVLIQDGTLNLGDNFVVGQFSGKVRAMLDDKGRKIKTAGPAIPVEVQGLSGVPSAGDEFIVVSDEKMARSVAQERSMKARENELGANSKISLDKLFEQMSEGDVQELRVVLRADVQGTLEAFAKTAEDLSTKEIKVRILHEGTGTITESDILLASASDAIIIGFNVRPTVKVKELATRESVDVRSYDVIYHALDDIKKAMVGMLEPTFEEEVIGLAEVRDTFSVPKVGTIAGCAVIDGKIIRSAKVRVLREGVVIYTGKIESLRRFKDDVKEVVTGYECGISVEKFNDIKVGDSFEAFVMNEVEATLE